MSVHLSLYLPVAPSVPLSLCIILSYVCFSVSSVCFFCLSACLFVFPSMSVYLSALGGSVHLFFCLCVFLLDCAMSVSLSVCKSVLLSIGLSPVQMPICLSVCMWVFLFVFLPVETSGFGILLPFFGP